MAGEGGPQAFNVTGEAGQLGGPLYTDGDHTHGLTPA